MEKKHTRGSFTGSIGFVLAAAGSAVGLGNIWRFPYLAAKDGGGTFILVYIVLALTFGFTLLTTDIAIGRKTGQSPLVAYGKIHPGWNGLGLLASIVPVVILPYYCSIGGWVLKYLSVFLTGHGTAAAEDGYFTGYITGTWQPIVWLGIYLFLTAFVVYRGVNKGIENYSKILMPILLILIIGISVFSLTLTHTDAVLCKKLHQPFPLFPDFCCCDRHPKRRVQIFFPAHRHCVVNCVKNRIEIQVIPGNRVHVEVFPCFSSQTRFQFFFLFPCRPFLLLFSPFLPQLYQLLFLFISVILCHPNSQQYQNHKNSCCRVQFFHVLSPSFFLLCIISLLILSYSSTEPSSLPDFVAKIISTAACTASLCELLPSPMQVERVSIF